MKPIIKNLSSAFPADICSPNDSIRWDGDIFKWGYECSGTVPA
jgi:hypothetical protein